MPKRSASLLSPFLALVTGLFAAWPPPKPPVTPPAEHPRLYLRQADLPAMKRRLEDPVFAAYVRKMRADCAAAWDGTLPVLKNGATYDPKIHDLVESRALKFLLENDLDAGRSALALLRAALPVLTFPKEQDITRAMGATIHTIAIAYDWCFPLLSADDKSFLIERIKGIAKDTEVGYPPRGGGDIVGHTGEAQIFRDQLSAGIAVYGEDPEVWDFAAGRMFDGLVPSREFIYRGGWHPQGAGAGYGRVRLCWELWAAAILKRMDGSDLFSEHVKEMAFPWIHARRPDGQFFPDGDQGEVSRAWKEDLGDNHLHWVELFTVFLSGDPFVARSLADNLARRDRLTSTLPWFLFARPEVEKRPLADLSRSRFFPDPAGILLSRTGWRFGKDSGDAAVMMKGATWMFNNHQHLDAGHFQLWYKGALAVDTGAYQGTTGGYGCDHFMNYYQRSVAHNTLLVHDPEEKPVYKKGRNVTPVVNDGGQLWPKDGEEPSTLDALTNGPHRRGEILGHGAFPDANRPTSTHLTVRMDGYGSKVENATRSFVFLDLGLADHPAALVVYDRVRSAKASFRKSWLVHTLQEPRLSEGRFVADEERGGRMVGDVLLPKAGDRHFELVGGEGKEFFVGGVNHPQVPKKVPLAETEAAGWRLELSPVEERKQDRFLVAMQVQDRDDAVSPLPVLPIEGEKVTGLRIADRVVIFPLADGHLDGEVRFEVSGSSARVVLVGLREGTWRFVVNGKERRAKVDAVSRALEIEGASGRVDLARVGD